MGDLQGEDGSGTAPPSWDLSPLYSGVDDHRISDELVWIVSEAERFQRVHRGQLRNLRASDLVDAVTWLEQIYERMTRVGEYARLNLAADTSQPLARRLHQRVGEVGVRLEQETLFFLLEWMSLDDGHAQEAITHPAARTYAHFLSTSRRFRPHRLSESEERLLRQTRLVGHDAWMRLVAETHARITPELDGQGRTLEQCLAALQDPGRNRRRHAAEAVTRALERDLETLTFALNSLILDAQLDSESRGYEHWLQRVNLENMIADQSVKALIDAVVDKYSVSHRFYRLKARLLGLRCIEDFDRVAPVPGGVIRMSWAHARNLVIETFYDFDPAAGEFMSRCFAERRVDARVGPAKTPGAFCSQPTDLTDPFVLLSFTGDRRSIMELAHELGHALHYWLARQQSFFNARISPPVSEIGSVFAELLVLHELLSREQAPRQKLSLLVGALDDAMATVYRQTAMHRFVCAFHDARRTQGELSSAELGDLWLKHQKEMFGDAVVLNSGYALWWSYVPHFFISPGYFYSYPLGYLLAAELYQQFREDRRAFVPRYVSALSAGGSESPSAIVRRLGISMEDGEVWTAGIRFIETLVTEAERLAAAQGVSGHNAPLAP